LSLVFDEHRQYLADHARVDAFDRALREIVRPGDIVLDLAAGTGILSFLACRAGAARVYAIESTSLVEEGRAIANANGLADRVSFVQEWSRFATLPERVDVIVTDQIGQIGFDAGVIEYVADTRQRLLKPDGRIVPERLELMAAPVSDPDVRKAIDFWNVPVSGFDYSTVYDRAACSGYPRHVSKEQLLAPPASVVTIDLATADAAPIRGRVEFVLDRAAAVDGVGMWFSAALSPTVVMTNDPFSPTRINRRQVVLPIAPAIQAARGDRVEFVFAARPIEVVVDWRIAVYSGADRRLIGSDHRSTFGGMLLSREDLDITAPQRVPVLTPAGLARRTVLDLCDGRSIEAIERGVRERHPELLPTTAVASAFVAEVLRIYAR
jgi:protein arginine N-methyltransferase 1